MSTGASREAPVDNKCFSISHRKSHIQTNKLRPTGLGIQASARACSAAALAPSAQGHPELKDLCPRRLRERAVAEGRRYEPRLNEFTLVGDLALTPDVAHLLDAVHQRFREQLALAARVIDLQTDLLPGAVVVVVLVLVVVVSRS